MRYLIEPRDIIYVKKYGFLSFAKSMGKSLRNKYGQKSFDSAEKSTTDHIFLKTFNSEYEAIKVWFTDQNSQPLEIEDRKNLTMVIK